jgi:hypothetical protein
MADMPILLMRHEMSGTGEGGQTAGCINAGMPSPLSSGIGSMGWSMGEQASGGFNAGMPSLLRSSKFGVGSMGGFSTSMGALTCGNPSSSVSCPRGLMQQEHAQQQMDPWQPMPAAATAVQEPQDGRSMRTPMDESIIIMLLLVTRSGTHRQPRLALTRLTTGLY